MRTLHHIEKQLGEQLDMGQTSCLHKVTIKMKKTNSLKTKKMLFVEYLIYAKENIGKHRIGTTLQQSMARKHAKVLAL